MLIVDAVAFEGKSQTKHDVASLNASTGLWKVMIDAEPKFNPCMLYMRFQ